MGLLKNQRRFHKRAVRRVQENTNFVPEHRHAGNLYNCNYLRHIHSSDTAQFLIDFSEGTALIYRVSVHVLGLMGVLVEPAGQLPPFP
jgi:hypothetical protein